jgi:hypothetical protein
VAKVKETLADARVSARLINIKSFLLDGLTDGVIKAVYYFGDLDYLTKIIFS